MKIIDDFPDYGITENGDVYRLNTMHKLKQVKRWGYSEVHLFKNGKGKNVKVHRLVAKAFIPNPYELPCVNHKDENRSNNNVENLEWCSYKYNNYYGNSKPVNNLKLGAIKNSKKVQQFSLQGVLISEYNSVREAMRKTGFNQTNIGKCCNGVYKQAYGFYWKYKEKNEATTI